MEEMMRVAVISSPSALELQLAIADSLGGDYARYSFWENFWMVSSEANRVFRGC
jgi:hypothetical protein